MCLKSRIFLNVSFIVILECINGMENNLEIRYPTSFLLAVAILPNPTMAWLRARRPIRRVMNITEIKETIELQNDLQTITNRQLYGPVDSDTVIIAVQVHDRIKYLRYLIQSLSQAQHIDRALIIFSHDVYDENMNELIRNIRFAMVMQIFYPYSIQTHPSQFPGQDPGDCPRDASRKWAKELKCNNADNPDTYGHYREAHIVQPKHHWWWKANRIFNQLDVTAHHEGMVLFLEDDHYVSEDFLTVLMSLRAMADHRCPQCEFLNVGRHFEKAGRFYYFNNWNDVQIVPWKSIDHNIGFAFNRTVWNDILRLQNLFCQYDDYNWDFSLAHLSAKRQEAVGKPEFYTLLVKGPRVYHIGECGFHSRNNWCKDTWIDSVKRMLQTVKERESSKMRSLPRHRRKRDLNGGWMDVRDHALCYNMTQEERRPYREWTLTTTEEIPAKLLWLHI